MKKTPVNADNAVKPPSHYHQAMLVADASETLYISGQFPVAPDSGVPESFEDQARLVLDNIIKQLAAAEMTLDHLVKVTFYLSSREYAMDNRKVREEVLGERDVARTAIICEIFDDAWLLEIEAIAAK